jgi:hypothetical protein
MQRDVADDPVALVENGDHRHALRHRSDSGLVRPRRLVAAGGRRGVPLLRAAVAGGHHEREQK